MLLGFTNTRLQASCIVYVLVVLVLLGFTNTRLQASCIVYVLVV